MVFAAGYSTVVATVIINMVVGLLTNSPACSRIQFCSWMVQLGHRDQSRVSAAILSGLSLIPFLGFYLFRKVLYK